MPIANLMIFLWWTYNKLMILLCLRNRLTHDHGMIYTWCGVIAWCVMWSGQYMVPTTVSFWSVSLCVCQLSVCLSFDCLHCLCIYCIYCLWLCLFCWNFESLTWELLKDSLFETSLETLNKSDTIIEETTFGHDLL